MVEKLEDSIKIQGCLKTSENQLFTNRSDKDLDLVFDVPGEFCSMDGYLFSDMTFRETGTDSVRLFGLSPELTLWISATGNIRYNSKELGRHEIFGGLAQFLGPTFNDKLKKFLKKEGLSSKPIDTCSDNAIWNSMIEWGNLRRNLNRDRQGIPYDVFVEGVSDNVPRMGFRSPAYLGLGRDDLVFATPYLEFMTSNYYNRLGCALKLLFGGNNQIGRSKKITRIFDRADVAKWKVPSGFNVDGIDSELIENSYKKLRNYLLTKPLVKRD
ncbi:MAG: hypothetical protein WC548_02115 [Candidatus Pacearchaeota archaeon]